MTRYITTLCWLSIAAGELVAQDPPKGYKTTESGFHYKIHTKSDGRQAQETDMIKLNLQLSTASDSVVFSTYDLPDNPIDYKVRKPTFNGDIMEAFTFLREGDSATFFVRADSLYRQFKPEFAKPGMWMRYDIKLYEVLTAEVHKTRGEAIRKARIAADLATIDSVLKERSIPAELHGNIYIHWHKRGQGKVAELGADVSVHYNGRLLDGKKFDSSVERNEPFTLRVGAGQVIEGWEEALLQLSEGDSVTVYIPSALGYAERGAGQVIPPHAILVFDIEVLDIYNYQTRLEHDLARLRAIINERGVAVQPVGEGMFFYRTKTGDGPQPAEGKQVTLRYTIYLTDGTSVYTSGDPENVTLGDNVLVEGIEQALPILRAGTVAVLFIPSPLGFGRSASRRIPSNSILEVHLEVLEVE